MRSLVTIQKIKSVSSIPNADRIELVEILGWKCVAKKGEFSTGDYCIYYEIDSVVPEHPDYEFLKNKKYRVKTLKLGKFNVVSQGLALPLTILKNHCNYDPITMSIITDKIDNSTNQITGQIVSKIEEGLDITDILKVKKYEPEPSFWMRLGGEIKNEFPSVCRKSDEIRMQSVYPAILDEFHGKQCVITIKEDGTSATYFYYNGGAGTCTRNFEIKRPEDNRLSKASVYWYIENKYNIHEKLKNYNKFIQLIGEIIGPKIQTNSRQLLDHEIKFFTAFDINKQSYINYDGLCEICRDLDLPKVETITDQFVFDKNIHNLDYFLTMTDMNYNDNKEYPIEGIVIRPTNECYSPLLKGRLSIKVINNKYLLKHE